MKLVRALPIVLALGGCAGAAALESETTVARRGAQQAEAHEARGEVRRVRERIRELEAQLGLARAEAQQLRDEVAQRRSADRRRATRILPRCEAGSDPVVENAETLGEGTGRDDGPRPLLRLYGDGTSPSLAPTRESAVRPLPGPEAPAFVGPPPAGGWRLPVTAASRSPRDGVPAIPPEPLEVVGDVGPHGRPERSRAPGSRPAVSEDPVVREYRAALRHLSESRLSEALSGLEAFVREHPSHPYADNAMYWSGEVHYARRDYRRAMGSFESLVERYPRGNKVPDALLRIGLCLTRMGQQARARRVFERLRAQYPDSVAAQMASQEGA